MREWFHITWSHLSAVFRKERLDRQFDEELSTHLELLIDEYRRGGMSPAEARREAMRKLGHPESLRESHRDQCGIPVLEMFAQDLRYGFRMLRKAPGFTVVIVAHAGAWDRSKHCHFHASCTECCCGPSTIQNPIS